MTTPIGIGDISQAVGNSSLDLGTLVAEGNIKKWALHKPVKLLSSYDTPNDIYPDDATWLNYMQNRVSETANNILCPYGLKVGSSMNIYDVIGVNDAPTVDWVYQQPPATGTFWRRMLDFKGYTNNPNPPINPIDNFSYYKDSTNIITIDTNEGEASYTSIQLSELNTLNNYQLMLAIKKDSDHWILTVMPTMIPASVQANVINFTLPAYLDLSQGIYDAYLVGVYYNSQNALNTGVWLLQNDTSMQTFSHNMLPLPLPYKSDCHFRFTVKNVNPINEINVSYTFYLNSNNVIQSIVFDAWKDGQVTATSGTFTLTLSNLIVYDDNDNQVQALSNSIVTMNSFTYDSTTNTSSCSTTLNVSSYNINAGSNPNLEGGDQDRIANNSTHNGAYPYVIINQGASWETVS